MEFAIAVVIHGLDVKKSETFLILRMEHVCLEVYLLIAENVLGPHFNPDYYSVLSNSFSVGHF